MTTSLTYPEVGATAGDLPSGYHHLRERRLVGHGREAFARASELVLTWGMHRGAGLRVVEGPPRADVDADVVLRWLGRRIPCRVVRLVDEPDRRGFAYGTLDGHPERGEESFVVRHDRASDEVWLDVVAFSRPATWSARALGPLGRALQAHVTRRYLEAVASA